MQTGPEVESNPGAHHLLRANRLFPDRRTNPGGLDLSIKYVAITKGGGVTERGETESQIT
jgi:hypothetical protein